MESTLYTSRILTFENQMDVLLARPHMGVTINVVWQATPLVLDVQGVTKPRPVVPAATQVRSRNYF